MSEIKAIETRYAGCRFRSRLEARWAVFFEALGVKWQYETEGFRLPDGRQYLPDFTIWDYEGREILVETKAIFPALSGLAKAIDSSLLADKPLLLIVGYPGKYLEKIERSAMGGGYFMVLINRCVIDVSEMWDRERLTDDEVVDMTFAALKDESLVEFGVSPFSKRGSVLVHKTIPDRAHIGVWQAINTARSARFEFGESG